MIRFEIPEAIPSANAFMWAHWTRKHRIKTHWAWLVRIAKMDYLVAGHMYALPRPSHAVIRVVLTRIGKRELDHDNYVSGAKFAMDALVDEGFLLGDRPDQVQITYLQSKGSPEKTIIEIG
jgi:hypothetical protein